MKKLFFISGSFFILVLLFLGVYNFAFRNNNASPIVNEETPHETAEVPIQQTKDTRPSVTFEQVLGESVSQPILSQNNILYYSKRDHTIKESTLNGKDTVIRLENIPGALVRLVWSPNRTGVLMLIRDDRGELWHYGDLQSKSIVPLKEEMSRLAWTSLGDRIVYQFTDPATGDRSLNLSAADGSNWMKIAELGKDDHFITTIPQSSLVAFWQKTDGNQQSTLNTVAITGENRKAILPNFFGADFLWSPDSRKILVQSVSATHKQTPILGLVDGDGEGYQDLLVPTLISKITWSRDSETFYYALPGAFPSDSILPNDYFAKPLFTKDTFWKMNVRTGKKERLVPLEAMDRAFDVSNLFLSPEETDLYFTDRATEKLYRITL